MTQERGEDYFVNKDSIVRQIWGKSDTILFIFAGAAAEFALSKAVDWLYFTGRLPADPIGRLFTTVSYARTIVFSKTPAAFHAIDTMTSIHSRVEAERGSTIPEWAYRDVLFMLIDYSIRAFELLERKMTIAEKNEVFETFHKLGNRMALSGLPQTFDKWELMRQVHLKQNLQNSPFTTDLFTQYRKHLGLMRYKILLEAQTRVVPEYVRELLGLRKISFLLPMIALYKVSRVIKFNRLLKTLVLPSAYKKQIEDLDQQA